MKTKVIIIQLLILFLMKAQAQQDSYISLENILLQAEAHYPSILQYDYTIQALQSKAEGAKAWMPPVFSGGLMRWPYNLSMLNENDNPMNQAGMGFSIEQMIPNKAKLNTKKDYYASLADIEKSKSKWAKNELRRETKILYYSRYANEKKIKIILESQEILNLLLKTEEEKFSNNQSDFQTIYKAKARLAELKNMQLMIESIISESNIGINILMEKDVNTSFKIDTFIKIPSYSILLADTSGIALRSDIEMASKNIHSMQLEQKMMQTANRPDFGIKAEHMQMFGMPDQWSLMGMISIPIVPWSAKMYQSEVMSSGFQIQAMEQEKKAMQLMALRMQAEKLNMLKYEYRQYENFEKEIIPAFDNNLQANILAYKQNTGDFFILLDAWEMLLMKKIEMYDNAYRILKLTAEYEYEKEIR
jgi:hypothetical protein